MSLVRVAVGVVIDERQRVLIAHRDEHQHQGGLWEFPGGKLEPGESVQRALRRELHEELAIRVERCEAWLQIEHDYGDKRVLLEVRRVAEFIGHPTGMQGQRVRWVDIAELENYAFPAANAAILAKIYREFAASQA